MQAVISAIAIKPFTKTLAALAKYGDNVDISATPEHMNLSSINSSKTAYGRVKLLPEFFEKYRVGPAGIAFDVEEVESVNGSVLVKALLSVFKNRTSEKAAVERCEVTILPGQAPPCLTGSTSASTSSAQSALVLRFYCKRGIVRTHRLSLNTIHEPGAPAIPTSDTQASVVVGPRAVKDLIDHFARTKAKGARSDVPLVWTWDENEVRVKSLKGFAGKDSDSQISTAITLEAEELDEYIVPNPPVVFAFHLREFMASTILAEALSLQLNISFTEAFDPLIITVTEQTHESLFLIQTKDVSQAEKAESATTGRNKRARESTSVGAEQRKKKATLAIERPASRPSSAVNSRPSFAVANVNHPDANEDPEIEVAPGLDRDTRGSVPPASMRSTARPSGHGAASSSSRPQTQASAGRSMLPPPDPSQAKSYRANQQHATSSAQTMISHQNAAFATASPSKPPGNSSAPAFSYMPTPVRSRTNKQPLFFPFSQSSSGLNSPPTVSQSFSLTPADVAAMKESGLRIEDMTHAEFAAMLDDDADEVSEPRSKKAPSSTSMRSSRPKESSPEWEVFDDDEGIEWTQLDAVVATKKDKNFQPLAFDDE